LNLRHFARTLLLFAPALTLPLLTKPHCTQTRLISDIDDTINYTNVTGGAQPAFYNAFVRDLQEVTIPATSEWYPELEGKNVGYSYVVCIASHAAVQIY
jgi:phosphatidate phosphatase APP1